MLKRLRSAAIQSIMGNALQKAIPFVASICVARFAGLEDFATFAFFISTANTIMALSALGLAPAILTELAGCRSRSDIEDRIAAIYLISAMLCLISAVLGLLGARFSHNTIGNSSHFSVVALLAPALILLQTTQYVYQGTNRHRAFFFQSCILAIVVAGTLLLISAVHMNSLLLSGYSAAFLLVGFGSAINLLGNMKGKFMQVILGARLTFRSVITSQLPFAGYTALWMLAIYLCNLRIASNFTVSDLAYYNVGFQWYSLMLLVPATLSGVLIPHFASAGDTDTARRQNLRLSLLFAIIALPLTLLMLLSAPWLLHLYGMTSSPQGLASVRYLILAGGIAFTLTPALQQLMALRRFRALVSVSATWSIVALTGAYVFASNSEGVAFSFFLAYCTVTLLIFFTMTTMKQEQTPCKP